MKQRLLVMNGQRIVQAEHDGKWINQKVDKAGEIKPGIYNVYLATEADRTAKYSGVVLHADAAAVYQQIGKAFVSHPKAAFDKLPDVGTSRTIAYDEQGRAHSRVMEAQQVRSRSR